MSDFKPTTRVPVARDVYLYRRDAGDAPVEVTIKRVRPPLLTFEDAEGTKTKIEIVRFGSRSELVRASPIADVPAEERARTSPPEPVMPRASTVRSEVSDT